MKILNTLAEDYHVHSINYSDGMNTIDELVAYAGKIGMKKIAITDHSQACLDVTGFTKQCWRSSISKWKNIHNDVEVLFGVEGDLLNEDGNCCFDIQGKTPKICILSCHEHVYSGDYSKLTQAYINAIQRYHDQISFIGHLNKPGTVEYIDLPLIIKLANQYKIPIEINASYFPKFDQKLFRLLLDLSDSLYINSDTHMLSDLSSRAVVFDFLRQDGYLE